MRAQMRRVSWKVKGRVTCDNISIEQWLMVVIHFSGGVASRARTRSAQYGQHAYPTKYLT